MMNMTVSMAKHFGAPLEIVYFRDCCVSSMLESSCVPYTLRFSSGCFLALTKKSYFLELPLNKTHQRKIPAYAQYNGIRQRHPYHLSIGQPHQWRDG